MSDDEDHYDDEDDSGGDAGGRNQGRWSREEHSAFMEGLRLHGREWKKIAAMIPTRTVVQIRTHAQKFFQKQAKGESGNYKEVEPSKIGSDKKRLKVSAPEARVREEIPIQVADAKVISAQAGGITPRTVAAATILMAPRHASQWMSQQSAHAAEVLDQRARRTSPRLSNYTLPPSWPNRGEESGKPSPSPPLFTNAPRAITSEQRDGR